ncbi:PREDICTED: 28S ribosomal protein S33, mitochondrial-like [Priapulus caudatus]|uniref:Small ribosomal subunit protein mS33 n=1 Tax=Priapulus caudatus TaxID=37621 RepID=A0ABM1F596_PRICU|nr:PREDICTED: 28S ribosomal protein S33, mitochondrial-like [Priapulus caudatus]XP_014679618.1 PREDICTED: 28S ribosomal protein S33, mitochondrial-like [Priapulus caudatus]
MAAASNYAKRMARLSARIFGEVTRPTNSKSMKVVTLFSEKPMQKREEVVDYYPNLPVIDRLMRQLRQLGLYRDEHLDFKEEMHRLRKLRGKGAPKKGEGKSARKK